MEKDIKYLNYKVYHSGNLSHEGTVPSILSLSGIEKQFNLGGVWLWHTCPEPVVLELSDGVKKFDTQSDRTPEEWFNYAESHGIGIANPHQAQ